MLDKSLYLLKIRIFDYGILKPGSQFQACNSGAGGADFKQIKADHIFHDFLDSGGIHAQPVRQNLGVMLKLEGDLLLVDRRGY